MAAKTKNAFLQFLSEFYSSIEMLCFQVGALDIFRKNRRFVGHVIVLKTVFTAWQQSCRALHPDFDFYELCDVSFGKITSNLMDFWRLLAPPLYDNGSKTKKRSRVYHIWEHKFCAISCFLSEIAWQSIGQCIWHYNYEHKTIPHSTSIVYLKVNEQLSVN